MPTIEELQAQLDATKKEADAAKAELEKMKADKNKGDDKDKDKGDDKDKNKDKDKGDEGDDLRDKIRKEKEAQAAKDGEIKGIEKALKFNLGVGEFVKTNVDVLPADIATIVATAEKERYDSAKEKASAVQAAIIQEFFAVQTNVDLLTASQKATLDDYLKLTKNGKEQKAEMVYENLFEPALETLKKVKKAEELGKARAGFATSSKVEDGYKARLMAGSRKTYLNEKGA